MGFNYVLDPIYEIPYQNICFEEIEKNLFFEYDKKFYKGKFCSNLQCPTNLGDKSFFIFNISKKIYETKANSFKVVYKCNDFSCSNFLNNTFSEILIKTENFEIIHNASEPIKKSECFPDASNETSCNYFIRDNFHDNETLYLTFKLSSILYEEKKGISRLFDYISGQEKKYRASHIEEDTKSIEYVSYPYYYENDLNFDNNEDEYENEEEEEPYYDGKFYHYLANVETRPMDEYDKYIRSEIGFLTVLANIGALFSTFKVVIAVFYQFYSKRYDNYEIIEKILRTELRKDKINKNIIKINDKNINTQMELSDFNQQEKENIKDNMTMPLIKSISDKENESDFKEVINSEEEKISEDKIDSKDEENTLVNEEERILPKLSFFEFYFIYIYFKICKRRKNQEIINLCDKIIFKYISIDNVLYNLIRLENLFKDYKWNNPQLNSLKNNEIIKELLEIL